MQSIHKNKRKKNIFIYITIIVVVIIANPFNLLDSVRNWTMKPVDSLMQIGFKSGSYLSDHFGMIANIGNLYFENQDLNNQIQQLKAEAVSVQDIENENEKLRKEVGLLPRKDFDLIGAQVILRDPFGGTQWLMIDRGKDSGVEIGRGVVVGESVFVGEVVEVNDNSSRIRLITHPDNLVNIVTSRTSAEALAYGRHGLSVEVEDIKKDDDVKEGDMFITSNIGNKFPRGLSVGTVQNIESSEDNLFKKATILPLASLRDLQFVFVIK